MKKLLYLIPAVISLAACNRIDNYAFGKDNSPAPEPLKPIEQKLSLKEQWTVPIGKAQKSNQYLKIKPVVLGSMIYAVDNDDQIQAIDKNNGRTLWTQK